MKKTEHIANRFADFCTTENYKRAADYLFTLDEIPSEVFEQIRKLDNVDLYEKAGDTLYRHGILPRYTFSYINETIEFLLRAAESGRLRCFLALAAIYSSSRLREPDIHKAMDYYFRAENLLIEEDGYFDYYNSLRCGLFQFLLHSKNEEDIRFAMDKIIYKAKKPLGIWIRFLHDLAEWQFRDMDKYNFFNMSVKEILDLPIYGLKGQYCVDIHSKRWFSPRKLGDVLDDETAYNYVLDAAKEGDGYCAEMLIKYCYKKGDFDNVLELLPLTKRPNRDNVEAIRILAAMYQKGQGVAQDIDKACELYHKCIKINAGFGAESDFYNLGMLYQSKYEQTGIRTYLVKARKYYRAAFSKSSRPSAHDDNEYTRTVNNAIRAYKELYRYCSSDVLRMKVCVNEDKICSFSLKSLLNTCIVIDWGEKGTSHESIPLCSQIRSHTRMEIDITHEYKKSGVYNITITTEGAYIIESFKFTEHPRQLLSVNLSRCPALKTFVVIGQKMNTLDFSKNKYLHGVICRDNQMKQLDLTSCPSITHLDCSCNPNATLLWNERSALTELCCKETDIDVETVTSQLLYKNRGAVRERMIEEELVKIDLRLEYYFRCSRWEDVVPVLEKGIKEKYGNKEEFDMGKAEKAYHALKSLDVRTYHFLYVSCMVHT